MTSSTDGEAGPGMRRFPQACIVVPVFNDATGLAGLLDALRDQTYPAFDVIVVDNGSVPPLEPPGNVAVRTRFVRCEKPGSYAARNAGAELADAEVLVFTDADCLPAPDWLDAGVRALREYGPGAVVGGAVEFRDPPRRSGAALYQSIVGFQQRENIEARGFTATANLFCSRETFQMVGPFDEDLLSGGDREWCWRAIACGSSIHYAAGAVVRTQPRTSLAASIRQARRVAAGRSRLRVRPAKAAPPAGLAPHRGALESVGWILRHPDLALMERLRVLCVAIAIRFAAQAELLRIRLGGQAERR